MDIWLTYNSELPQQRFGEYCKQELDSFDDLKVTLGREVHYPKGDPSVEALIARSKYNNAEYSDRKVICIATRSGKQILIYELCSSDFRRCLRESKEQQ